MTTKREELKELLLKALDEPLGLVFTIEGGRTGTRPLVLAALAAAKRELSLDLKEVLELSFKPVPGTMDEIAIVRVNAFDDN